VTDYLRRARSALHEWLHGRRHETDHPDRPAPPPGSAGSEESSAWATPVPDTPDRLVAALTPLPGLSRFLRSLRDSGALRQLLQIDVEDHALAAVQRLEQLPGETSLSGERFGTMLRELRSPELIVVAILLHDAQAGSPAAPDADGAVRAARPPLDRLGLGDDDRRTVEFLIGHQLDMSLIAFRQDTGDPSIVAGFASLFSNEDQLKMLCLMTVADLGAIGGDTFTPWKAEILWRLFVDTYNQMTLSYGDDLIDPHEAALTALKANRPHDIGDAEIVAFLEGLPRRYLTLFEPKIIYQHVRLSREMTPDDVHTLIQKRGEVWELTVITHDKPYLFSTICGVLSYGGFDILRGHALTSRGGIVLDVFEFTDHKGCRVKPQLEPLLPDAIAGRVDITARLAEQIASVNVTRTPPVIYFDNESSPRYTILEIVAGDVPGLLHRMSRIISRHQCVVDLVLISTEGTRAIDVFHVRRHDAKLTEADELALTEDFERLFEPDAHSSSG
jgi:[protein-PII] uridylyltransferase